METKVSFSKNRDGTYDPKVDIVEVGSGRGIVTFSSYSFTPIQNRLDKLSEEQFEVLKKGHIQFKFTDTTSQGTAWLTMEKIIAHTDQAPPSSKGKLATVILILGALGGVGGYLLYKKYVLDK